MARSGKPRITPRNAKNAVAVAKVIGPAIAPVMLPFVAKAAASLRAMKDQRKARKLGVPLDDLAKFSGKGGHLHARIAGLTDVVGELNTRSQDTEFTQETQTTLAQLAAAVKAAERMPTHRRKTAHKAVSQELDHLEDRLMHKLGI
jgi:ABC-type transporter Mla subunit MlaD